MKNKLFKKLLTIGLPLSLAACIFCTGASKKASPPGTLTITGIPAEYKNKFIKTEIWNIPNPTAKIKSSGAIANSEDRAVKGSDRLYMAIKDDRVELPVYIVKMFGQGDGYAGSDTTDIYIEIYERVAVVSQTAEPLPSIFGKRKDPEPAPETFSFTILSKAVIGAATFQNGVTEVKWEDAVKAMPINITVTNIPAEYQPVDQSDFRNTQIQIGEKLEKALGGVFISKGVSSQGGGNIRNGTATATIFPLGKNDAGNYITLPENCTVDIAVSLSPPSNDKGVSVAHVFLFKGVQITGSKAVLDLRRGVRQ